VRLTSRLAPLGTGVAAPAVKPGGASAKPQERTGVGMWWRGRAGKISDRSCVSDGRACKLAEGRNAEEPQVVGLRASNGSPVGRASTRSLACRERRARWLVRTCPHIALCSRKNLGRAAVCHGDARRVRHLATGDPHPPIRARWRLSSEASPAGSGLRGGTRGVGASQQYARARRGSP
jgi:hypothetical protein